jgi:glycosyltransferase involved in cell wall biosynthesis
MAYADVLFDLRRASVVAIPLTTEAGTVGLTELNDALALGKPVIMTRNRFIDVDIDAIGCGVWVDAGDVDGWTEALDRLLSDDALRAEMGRRGKAFAAQHWNADLFGRGVTDAFSSLARS